MIFIIKKKKKREREGRESERAGRHQQTEKSLSAPPSMAGTPSGKKLVSDHYPVYADIIL
jgi:hypothetical protein